MPHSGVNARNEAHADPGRSLRPAGAEGAARRREAVRGGAAAVGNRSGGGKAKVAHAVARGPVSPGDGFPARDSPEPDTRGDAPGAASPAHADPPRTRCAHGDAPGGGGFRGSGFAGGRTAGPRAGTGFAICTRGSRSGPQGVMISRAGSVDAPDRVPDGSGMPSSVPEPAAGRAACGRPNVRRRYAGGREHARAGADAPAGRSIPDGSVPPHPSGGPAPAPQGRADGTPANPTRGATPPASVRSVSPVPSGRRLPNL